MLLLLKLQKIREQVLIKNLTLKNILPDDFSSQSGEETVWYLRAVGWKNVTSLCVAGRVWDEGLGVFFELHARTPLLGLQLSCGTGLHWFGGCWGTGAIQPKPTREH